jgi:DnaJ-class molecular chaperone
MPEKTCFSCDGTGVNHAYDPGSFGITVPEFCPACGGRGKVPDYSNEEDDTETWKPRYRPSQEEINDILSFPQ